jgi:ABC-type glutathione transport system ATPase component
MMNASDPVVSIRDLTVELGDPDASGVRIGPVSMEVLPGQCLCLVGPSGAGKSTIGSALLGMVGQQGRVVSGSVEVAGQSLFEIGAEQLRRVRGGLVSMVFQDPTVILNPVRRVDKIFADVLAAHGVSDSAEQDRRSREALTSAHMDPDRVLRSYPHELSGGMRQRVCIALAVVNDPQLIVADEPTTALDPTAQVAIIELLAELRRRRALVVITHDFRVARRLADHVAVIAGGVVAEYGPAEQVFNAPKSEIARQLIASEQPVARGGRLLVTSSQADASEPLL